MRYISKLGFDLKHLSHGYHWLVIFQPATGEKPSQPVVPPNRPWSPATATADLGRARRRQLQLPARPLVARPSVASLWDAHRSQTPWCFRHVSAKVASCKSSNAVFVCMVFANRFRLQNRSSNLKVCKALEKIWQIG